MTQTLQFTTGDGCRIAYRFDGRADAPVLMLSNSLALSFHMWDGLFERLSRRFRVLRYDLRGHGGSDVPPGAYSLPRLGCDVVELLDHLALERVAFCGTSIGGFIGQWLGIHAPERLSRLVLSNTSPYVGPASQWDELIGQTLGQDIGATADALLDRWFSPSMAKRDPATVAHFRSMILQTAPAGIAGCLAAVRDADFRRTVPLVSTPTLVIGGEEDTPTLPSHSEAIAAAVPGAKLQFLPGIHMLCAEHPQAYADLVVPFLGHEPHRHRQAAMERGRHDPRT